MKFEINYENEHKRQKKSFKNKIYFILLLFLSITFFILLITYIILSSGNNTTTKNNTLEVKNDDNQTTTIYDEKSKERPIAYIIDNAVNDVNYAGLQDSYLNYEIIVEGGMTRIMALYKDKNISLIGPIRSLRHYFLDYSLENDAIIVHFGNSPQSEEDILKLNVDSINGIKENEPFRRDTKSKSPHNVYTNTTYIDNYVKKSNLINTSSNWKLFNISKEEINVNNEDKSNYANNINIIYSSDEYRTYTYDEGNRYYLRSQNGSPQIDRITKNQLHYKNIIVQKVENNAIDDYDRQSLNNIGRGEGYYITNGYYKKINWKKDDRVSKTIYTYQNGKQIDINDGNTFINIVPINSDIIIK